MKFTGSRQRLLDALTMVGSVVAPRSIKPILQNLRIVVDPGGATLLTTDLEVAIRCRVELPRVDEGGDLLLPVARLQGILRESDGEEVRVETEDRVVRISCGNGTFKMASDEPDDFPVVPSFEDQRALRMDRDPFRTLIRKTAFAAAKEKSRYAFNGVRFEVEGEEARMIATDGKRMAVKTVGIENPHALKIAQIIPTKGLQAFERALSENDPHVRIHFEDKQVMVRTGHTEVSSRLVEGNFPRYQSVIPKETALTATFPRQELAAAVRRAGILTNEESRAVRFSFEDGKLVLTSRAMDVGEARVELQSQFEGPPISVAFNPDFVVEGLKTIEADTITVRLSGKDTPARIDGEENYIYVVMPVTLRSG